MLDLCVVSYNTASKCDRLLQHLVRDDQYLPGAIYWADNNSTDLTREILLKYLEKYPHHNLNVHLNSTNFGYARAVNSLVSYGDNKYIGILNADVWMTPDDCHQIIEVFNENPDIAIIGPKQRDESGRITHAGIFGTMKQPKHRGWMELDLQDNLYRDRLDAVTVSGSAYFIRRSVWNSLLHCDRFNSIQPHAYGAFLVTPHYYEETFCSYHAQAHGYRVVYDGSISIGHSWHASSTVGGPAEGHMPRSRDIFRSACDLYGIPHD